MSDISLTKKEAIKQGSGGAGMNGYQAGTHQVAAFSRRSAFKASWGYLLRNKGLPPRS